MKWENLKLNKCPQCNKDFMKGLKVVSKVMFHPCGFKISELKFTEIVNKTLNSKPNIHYRPLDEEK